MKIVRRKEVRKFKNSSTCWGLEYFFDDPDLNIAVITVKGRYPEKGFSSNLICKEIAYVLSGNVNMVSSKGKILLKKGDSVLISAKEKYYWSGKCKIMTICNPAFDPEQHKITG